MKKQLLLASAAALAIGLSACHDPYEFTPTHHDDNLLSFTASFYNDNNPYNAFPAEIDYNAKTINVVFPYTYPPKSESFLTDANLTHVRVQANVVLGTKVEPDLVWLDLTKPHQITVTGLDGDTRQFTITSEIRKSNECEITDFTLQGGLSGAINPSTGVITFISPDDIGAKTATLIMSHGATISPDPRTTAINFDQEQEFTVTAQNGVDTRVYKTVKGEPTLLPFGANFGTATVRWATKLADLGIQPSMAVTSCAAGIGIAGDYIVLNQVGNPSAPYLNYKTGEPAGTIDLSAVGNSATGYLNNYRLTSDNNSNLIISSFSKDNGGTISLWRKKGIDGTVEPYLSHAAGVNVGDQLSVVGNLDGDAIITATINGSKIDFLRWTVTGGTLQSETPTLVHITGFDGTNWGNADVAYLNPSDPSGDYFAAGYCKFADIETAKRGAAYVSGADNTISSVGSRVVSSNWVINAADVIEFNNVRYAIHNSINTFTWGSDDNLYLYDLSTADLSSSPLDFGAGGLGLIGKYGAMACTNQGVARNGGDVKFAVSSNGIYLYIFFEFANGFVGMIQTDCLDM